MITTIAIVGSRSFEDYTIFEKKVLSVLDELNLSKSNIKIISGGARGSDTMAQFFAKDNNIAFQLFSPNWALHGKRAGILRNLEMLKEADLLIAFWDKMSKGTEHTITQSKTNQYLTKRFIFDVRQPQLNELFR